MNGCCRASFAANRRNNHMRFHGNMYKKGRGAALVYYLLRPLERSEYCLQEAILESDSAINAFSFSSNS